MGDKLTIPRSFAGALGVADVADSIKRSQYQFPHIANSTTGDIVEVDGLFPRNATLERVICSFYLKSTATTGTTLLSFRLMNGASTVFQSKKFNSTTILPTTGWITKSGSDAGSFSITSMTSSDKLKLVVDTNSPAAQVKKLNIILRYKEALDS